MVKDRLYELQQAQKNNEKNKSTTVQMEKNDVQNTPESGHKKLRKTFARSDVIAQWIEQIEKNNQDVRIYLRKIDDLNSQKDVEIKMQDLFQNNTSIAHQVTAKLKEVDTELKKLEIETAEGRIKSIQHATLKTRFQKAFLDNNELLENYKTIQKQILKAQLQAKGYFKVTDEEVSLLLEEGTDVQVFTENILAETAEAKRILADVEERHQKLQQIERMLTEVRDMFVQMAILVESQQELIDRIDYQAQNAAEHIGAVDLELESAVRKKKKYTRRKIYFVIAIIILIVIILILLFK